MTSLYALTGQYRQLADKLDSLEFDAETVADTIEASGIVDDIANMVQGCELVARSALSFNPAIEAEIARLQALKEYRERVAQGLRDYIKKSMECVGISKIECPLFTITIAKNPASVEVYEEALVPQEFWITPPPPAPRLDKKTIAEALKAGIDVAGAKLKHTTRLTVK